MLGGGIFTTQNKVLPGAYINFVSAASASAVLSERGVATMPLQLDWGKDGEIFEVTGEQFRKNCMKIFGYPYGHEKMKGLRDLFRNARSLYAYKLTSGGVKASNDYAEARCSGVRGNDIRIVIRSSVDGEGMFDVLTYLDGVKVDEQCAASANALKDNDYVVFKKAAELAVNAGTPLAGGTNGTVDGIAYQAYLNLAESYSFHAMGIVTEDESVKSLCAAFCKRLRDEAGVKFQLVAHGCAADYMGVINVKNSTADEGCSKAGLVYWVTGLAAGRGVNQSAQNYKYDGEFSIEADYTQTELADAIRAGEFTLHKCGSELRVLEDINSMVTVTEECGEVFRENQTIRVIDQLANDDALLFRNKYMGIVPNDAAGRMSLWSDLVKIRQLLQDIRAIENFTEADVTVEPGSTKKSVVANSTVQVVNAMSKLYMTNVIA